MERLKNKEYFWYIVLALIIVQIFKISYDMRRPHRKVISDWGFQSVTSQALSYAKIWYHESPIKNRFVMATEPKSIENEGKQIKERMVYISYPPGFIIPIYILSKIKGKTPTHKMVMFISLIFQLIMTLSICFFVFVFLRSMSYKPITSFIFSLVPLPILLFIPGAYYIFNSVYFVHSPTISMVSFLMFLEILDIKHRNKYWFNILYFLVVFYGCFCDYWFYFIIFFVFIKRIINREFGNKFRQIIINACLFSLPVFIALGCYIYQIIYLEMLGNIYEKAIYRMSLSKVDDPFVGKGNYFVSIFKGHVRGLFTRSGMYLLTLSVLYSIIGTILYLKYLKRCINSKAFKNMILFSMILLYSALIYNYLIKNATIIHPYMSIKFLLGLSIIPLIFIPITLSEIFKFNIESTNLNFNFNFKDEKKIITIPIIPLVFLIISIYYTVSSFHERYFSKPCYSCKEMGNFVNKKTLYDDVIFSPNLHISLGEHEKLAYSYKVVRKIDSIYDINNFIHSNNLKYKNFKINLLLKSEQINTLTPGLTCLKKHSQLTLSINYKLYKISNLDAYKKCEIMNDTKAQEIDKKIGIVPYPFRQFIKFNNLSKNAISKYWGKDQIIYSGPPVFSIDNEKMHSFMQLNKNNTKEYFLNFCSNCTKIKQSSSPYMIYSTNKVIVLAQKNCTMKFASKNVFLTVFPESHKDQIRLGLNGIMKKPIKFYELIGENDSVYCISVVKLPDFRIDQIEIKQTLEKENLFWTTSFKL